MSNKKSTPFSDLLNLSLGLGLFQTCCHSFTDFQDCILTKWLSR